MASKMARFSLNVLDSKQFPRRDIDLNDGESLVIGRSSKSDHKLQPSSTNCRFDCPVVSRAHALLLCNEGQLSIRDTGSLHGTFVNHQELVNDKTVVLQEGDVITLGAEVLRAHENYQAMRLVVNHHRPSVAERLPHTYAYESDLVDEEDVDEDEEDADIHFGVSSCSSLEAYAEVASSKQPLQSKAPAALAVSEAVQEMYSASEQPFTWHGLTMADPRTVPVASCDGTPFDISVDDELDSDDEEEELDLELSDDSDDSESESDSDDEPITTSIVVGTTSNTSARNEDEVPRTTMTEYEAVNNATMSAMGDRFAEREALFTERDSVYADRAKWAQDQMDRYNTVLMSSLPTPPTTHTHSSGQWYDPVRSAHEEGRPDVAKHARDTSLDEGLVPNVAMPAATADNADISPVQDGILPVTTVCDETKKRKHDAVEESSTADEQPATKKMVPARSQQQKLPARRLRTLPSRATVRKVATQASQVAVGAVLGMFGTVAFLSSPYAEQLIQWLD